MVAAYVNDGSGFKYLDNQMTDVQESTLFTDKVGDGKIFGIDALRPDGDDVFTTVRIDTAALNALKNTQFDEGEEAPTLTAGGNQDLIASAKHGDKVTIEVETQNILGSGAVSGEVHVVWADSTDDKVVDVENAFYTAEFTSRELFDGESKTFTVADGASGDQKKAFGNRQRVKLLAFVVDGAGNRSLGVLGADVGNGRNIVEDPTDADEAEAGDFVYIIDSEEPTVTMTRPKMGTTDPDSLRFTARDTGIVQIRNANAQEASGDASYNKSYDLMPMVFKVSEKLRSASITLGDSTITVAAAAESLVVSGGALSEPMTVIGENIVVSGNADETKTNMLDALESDPSEIEFASGVIKEPEDGGNTFDVTIVVQDEVGNETTETIEGALFDVKRPEFNEIFPNSAEVPLDEDNNDEETINPVTYQPSVRTKEVLDSLVVRYAQMDGPDSLIYSVPRDTRSWQTKTGSTPSRSPRKTRCWMAWITPCSSWRSTSPGTSARNGGARERRKSAHLYEGVREPAGRTPSWWRWTRSPRSR